jgi:hypothetical protein
VPRLASGWLGSPERLAGLGVDIGPGQADVAQHGVTELGELAALARALGRAQRCLAALADPPGEPGAAEPDQRDRLNRKRALRRASDCIGTSVDGIVRIPPQSSVG